MLPHEASTDPSRATACFYHCGKGIHFRKTRCYRTFCALHAKQVPGSMLSPVNFPAQLKAQCALRCPRCKWGKRREEQDERATCTSCFSRAVSDETGMEENATNKGQLYYLHCASTTAIVTRILDERRLREAIGVTFLPRCKRKKGPCSLGQGAYIKERGR